MRSHGTNGHVGDGHCIEKAANQQASSFSPIVHVDFKLTQQVLRGYSVKMVDNIAALGNWNDGHASSLSRCDHTLWVADIPVKAGTKVV